MKCECCDNQTEDEFRTSDIIYNLCANCMQGLIFLDLSPKQVQMLLDNKHSLSEFYLHGDFYDGETLEALQPYGRD